MNQELAFDEDHLARFVEAQSADYARALDEMRSGRKRTHWMWYVFPQLAALGRSDMARRYGIANADEARAYMQHPVLGARLNEVSRAVLAVDGRSALEIMGSPDDVKLRSCATLFAEVSGDPVFRQLLDKYFDGRPDATTLRLLAAG
ncbi:MAG: DUF1810 domain-containing protein [Gemmatimonadaceae bacterium]